MAYKHATKAIILARVSTAEQAQDGHFSIPAQLRILRDYVEKGGKFGAIKEVIGEYQFDESASKDRRKKFEEAIKIVEQYQEPVALIAEKVDRFQRSFKESVRFDEMRKNGTVELHFVSQGLALHRNSPAHEIMIWDAFVMFAKSYVQQLSDNVKRSIKEKLEQGRFPGGLVPVGYRNVTVEVAPGKTIKRIDIDPEKARYVKKCFELYATGKFTLESLAETMAHDGFTTKTKRVKVDGKLVVRGPKPVQTIDVYGILTNPFYFGKFYYKNPDTGERDLYVNRDSYPVLIGDWQLFEKVQKVLNSHNSRANGFKRNRFKFTKLLTCGFCGLSLTCEEMSRLYKKESPQRDEIYYHCTSAKLYKSSSWYRDNYGPDHSGVYIAKKGKKKGQEVNACPHRWWREGEIEELVLEELDQINYGEEIYDWLRSELKDEYNQRSNIVEKKITAAKKELSKNKDFLKNTIHSIMAEKNEDIKEAMRAEYERIKKDQVELKTKIELLEQSLESDADDVINSLRYCSNLKEKYLSLDNEGQRELLLSVFSKIEPWKGSFRIRRNKGKKFGKKVNVDHIHFEWNEPWKTLQLINLQDLIAEKEGLNISLVDLRENKDNYYDVSDGEAQYDLITKKKQTKASLFP